MSDHFTGVYVQGPSGEPVKVQSFRAPMEAMIMFRREAARLENRPGWRAMLMHEEWEGDKLVKLEEVP